MRQVHEVGIKKECIGKSKGGLSTKIHTACDALGNPTGFHLTPGKACDLEGADVLLPELVSDIQSFLADKAYDADERVLKLLDDAGVLPGEQVNAIKHFSPSCINRGETEK